MFKSGFFRTQLGHAALVSIAAMIAFTVFAQAQQHVARGDMLLSATPMVELA
jgi:hypothetical protein